ncbi:hypothetical protein YC2023_011803 [Brassica napus]
MIKWRCCPELVQFYGFRSVEVLLDTPPGSLKNCPEAKGGSVRVQISLSRPVSFFMVKPRFCPSRDQFRTVQSSRPLGFGHVLSDQPAASRLEHWKIEYSYRVECSHSCIVVLRGIFRHIGRSHGCDVDTTGAKPAYARHVWGGLVFPRPRIQRVLTLSPKSGLGTELGLVCIWFPLLEARLWQEAKSNLVTVALGCKALCLDAAGRVSGRTGRGHGVNFVTLSGSSLTRHVALPDHGVGLDGQSCSCLIVGWPVGISSPTLGRFGGVIVRLSINVPFYAPRMAQLHRKLWSTYSLKRKLCLSPMSSSRVFLGHDVDPTKDFLNWLTANPAAVSLVNPVEVVNVETLTIREIAAFIKRQPAKENGGDGAELEVPLPQCFIGTIGQTNKFRIKVAHFNFTSNRLSLIVTKIVSPAVLPPKDRPLDMPHMPISLSQNNHTASEVDSSMVIESSGGGFSYANSHPSSATDEEKKPKRIRRNG